MYRKLKKEKELLEEAHQTCEKLILDLKKDKSLLEERCKELEAKNKTGKTRRRTPAKKKEGDE